MFEFFCDFDNPADLRRLAVHGELEAPLLGLEVLVELAGPVADGADVQAELVGLLGCRADGVGVPLEGGDGRDVDEDVVARLEVEVVRTLDHQRHDLMEKR